MPICLHLFLHACWGALAARACPAGILAALPLAGWPLATALGVAAACLTPCTTWQLRFFFDHACSYAVDPALWPRLMAQVPALSVAAALANLGALVAGFAAVRSEARAPGRRRVAAVLTALAVLALPALVQPSNVWHLGTYAQHWAGEAAPLWRVPSAIVAVLAYPVAYILQRTATARLAPMLEAGR